MVSATASSTEPVAEPAGAGTAGATAGPPQVPGAASVGAASVTGATRPPMRTRVAGSVRFRLTVSVVLVVGLSLLGGGALLVRWVEATLINDLKVRNEQILESMAASITRSRVPSEFFAPVDEVGMDDATRQVFGEGADAEEAISTTYFYMDGAIPEYLPGLNSDGELGLFQRQGPPMSSAQTVEVTRDIPTADGVITLHAVSSVSDIMRSVGALSAALWLGLPILVVGSGVMTWLITGRTLAPVGVMTRRVRELSATTLDARVPVPPTDDEISELASTMNEMLDRLQAAEAVLHQLLDLLRTDDEAVEFDRFEGRQGGRAGDRVAAVGAAQT